MYFMKNIYKEYISSCFAHIFLISVIVSPIIWPQRRHWTASASLVYAMLFLYSSLTYQIFREVNVLTNNSRNRNPLLPLFIRRVTHTSLTLW